MKKKRIEVSLIPTVGTVVMLDGQRYLCSDIRPPTSETGIVVVWQTHCARCGQSMQITTAHIARLIPVSFNRRCPLHVAPGVRVRKIALVKSA